MGGDLVVKIQLSHVGASGFTLDAEFVAPPGITILFGPSGSGKSTTLAAIAGLMRPDAGRIEYCGETWFDADRRIDRPIHLRGVALVFQSLALFPHLTALGNVEYGIDRRVPRTERLLRSRAMLERMRVPHLDGRKPSTFSGGEAQRVALARAFAMSPRIILLDEAFSAMDRDLRRDLTQDVRRWMDEAKIPMIQVTHHRNDARAMGDRVVLMRGGRVEAAGSVNEMLPENEMLSEEGGLR